MTNKTNEAYHDVFKFIEQKSFKLEPSLCMTDYEDGMRSAIKKMWPNCDVRGCKFHYKQAIIRRCKTDRILKELLEKSPLARKIKRMLMSIPLLPAERILEGFQIIKDLAKEKKMSLKFADLFSYFENYWLRKVRLNRFKKSYIKRHQLFMY